MTDNTDLPDEERGLYAKYRVIKTTTLAYAAIDPNADDAHIMIQGIPQVEETAPGMFLKFDDPAAQDAFYVYANSVKKKYPKLAADIKEQIYAAVERAQDKVEYGVWHPEDGSINPRGNNYEQASGMAKAIEGKIVYKEPGSDEWIFETPMTFELPKDWEPLGEDVTMHTMMCGQKHADGRVCSYHSRLQSWTFDGDKRCLRTDHPTMVGA